MKIRTSFVTNSSSSSYIISYKPKKYTPEEIEKFPELVMMSDFVKTVLIGVENNSNCCEETEQGEWITSKDDLWKYYLLNAWDKNAMKKFNNIEEYYASLEEYDYDRELYEKVMPILEEGKIAIVRQISYHDNSLIELINELSEIGLIKIVEVND